MQRPFWRDGRDLKHSAPLGLTRNDKEIRDSAVAAYLDFLKSSGNPMRMGTPGVSVELARDLRVAADALRSGRPLSGEERERVAAALDAVSEVLGTPDVSEGVA